MEQDLAERQADLLPFALRQVRDFLYKLQQAIGGSHLAADLQLDPLRRRRQEFDSIIPTRCLSRHLDHVPQLLERVGRREKTESMLAHRCEHIRGRVFIRQNNEASVRPPDANFAEQVNIFLAGCFLARDNQLERFSFRGLKGGLVGGYMLDCPDAWLQDLDNKALQV